MNLIFDDWSMGRLDSIDRYDSRRLKIAPVLVVFLILLASFAISARAGEIDLGRNVSNTPYDRYNAPVRHVLGKCGAKSVSIETVRSQLRTARRFRYYFDASNPYEPARPEVTEAKQAGDCKAKSLWLANKLGDRNVRYVVGKPTANSRLDHAWLLWPQNGIWYAVDPTIESDLVLADRIVGRKLISHYSYGVRGAFIHTSYSTYVK